MNPADTPRDSGNEENWEAKEIITKLNDLALVRTVLSSERSLMSWMRTSASMFSFGFSIIKFFDYLRELPGASTLPAGTRRLGIALICVGFLTLLLAAFEHVSRTRTMVKLGLPQTSPIRAATGIAIVLALVGVGTVVGLISR